MYLKSLELQGFKSFPDKTVLTFGDGITAIVGPNGSGKSNISDAVRWVLGEQSTRTLRGSKMEDVIFGGTQKRSAVGYAEVSLTIDNSDGALKTEYNEVTVTRRYYRSGESEFYINRNAVRLRDIHELFMDTGLGRDGYSIIGQGRIDEILSVKSEDRREIFEEASGISKFRHRKDEAERKLNATEENLIRIRDIITELETQVGPLAKQAEQAKKYLQIRDELKELEINVWMHSLDKIHADADKYANDYSVALSQFERGKALVDQLYAEVEELSEKMREKDVESENIRLTLRDAENAMREEENRISLLKQNIENALTNIARIENEISDDSTRAGGIDAQIKEREEKIELLKKDESDLAVKISELSEKIENAAKSSDDVTVKLEALRAKKLEYTDSASRARVELSATLTAEENYKTRKEEIEKELAEREETLLSTREKSNAAKKEYDDAQDECDSINNRLAGFELKEKNRRERLEKLGEKHRQMTISVESMQEKLNMLIDLEKDMQGYSHAVKDVLRAGDNGTLSGIRGVVSKLIRVKDEYALAVETALGNAMQNIVVENESDAKKAISLLKTSGAGRATFLPMSVVKGNILSDKDIEKAEGFVGVASELIDFDSCYDSVFKFLLGRIAVAENLDCATKLAKQSGYRFRVVTLDGQVINSGGSYTGGSTVKTAGILSRANEIKRLEKDLEEKKEKLRLLTEEKTEAEREDQKITYETEIYYNDKRRAEDTLLKTGTELEHFRLLLDSLNVAIDSLNDELTSLAARTSKSASERDELNAQIVDFENKATSCQDEIDAMLKDHSELVEQRGLLSDELSDMRLRSAEIRSECAESEKILIELCQLSSAMEGDRDAKRKLIDDYRNEIATFDAEITKINCVLEEKKTEIEKINAHIIAISDKKLEIEAERNKKDKESKQKNEEILFLERERARLENKKNAAELEEKQINDKLWENYELTVMAARALAKPLESVGEAKSRVSELKNERKKLGNVNVGAIEEYQRVSERFEFLSTQRDDLEKSKTELLRMIEELTGEMKTIFSEQFEIINRNFSETFTEIFGGGKAELRLEDPDDILNCGIEIKVQPPGKTLRTITLLSGGERAFVAIALYFAIMKVRPTPFCVLDEIEAALDDVNVVRYATYLRKLASTTQFIVITHRRGTMEEADVLYGVTMQEQGISKMLTISIAEVEKELKIKLK